MALNKDEFRHRTNRCRDFRKFCKRHNFRAKVWATFWVTHDDTVTSVKKIIGAEKKCECGRSENRKALVFERRTVVLAEISHKRHARELESCSQQREFVEAVRGSVKTGPNNRRTKKRTFLSCKKDSVSAIPPEPWPMTDMVVSSPS